MKYRFSTMALLVAVPMASSAAAQTAEQPPAVVPSVVNTATEPAQNGPPTDAAAPAAPAPVAASAVPDIDPATLTLPSLAFTVTPELAADFDKYYVFNRAQTSFAEALSDLRECDAFARGLSVGPRGSGQSFYYTNTAGLAGGVIGNLLVSAIFGSAEKRRIRRVNMRRCMHYKGYDRFGLPKDVWEQFNFEEGFSGVSEQDRQRYLAQQALVASGPRPQQEALGR